ncbi:MAG: ZIP family metal transporter [Anaerolineae bacterium]
MIPVLFTRTVSHSLLAIMLGMAAGVMVAASFWPLLAPAIRLADGSWVPISIGFLAGGAGLLGIDALLPNMYPSLRDCTEEGVHTTWRHSVLLVLAVTLQNITEGLTVGVAFSAVDAGIPEASLAGGLVLAPGIGIQNLPEGMAIAMPLRCEGLMKWQAFGWGALSGIVEPIAAVLGAWLVLVMRPILPYALAFAAGAIIYVVVEELIPEAGAQGHGHLVTIGAMLGFTVMMVLEVALG